MTRIKVLHYLNNIDIAGTTKTALLFAKHLDRSEFTPYLCTSDRTNFRDPGVADRVDQFLKAIGDQSAFHVKYGDGTAFQKVLDTVKPDILHLYRAGSPEFPQPGVDFLPGQTKVVETNVFGLLDYSPHIHKSLFMSKWLMDNTLQNFTVGSLPLGKFDFINNPTESPALADADHEIFGLPNDGVVLLGRVGRADNGIYDDIALRAIRILLDRGYNLEVVSAGTPPNMLKDLEAWDIPYTDFGIVSDERKLSCCYQIMDIYCHARSDGETGGCTIIESMANSLPVITHKAVPKIPGMAVFQAQTVLVEHGKTGFVVDPYSVEDYVKYLEILVCNAQLRKQMGRAGFDKVMREFHVYPVIKKLEGIYKELLK